MQDKQEKILLKNGRILDPATGFDEIGDIFIENGTIREIGGNTADDKTMKVLDMEGQWIMPGLIDAFMSTGEPGREDVETLQEVSLRAARSGFTAILLLPDSMPPIDNQALVKFIISEGKVSPIQILPMGCLTQHADGLHLAEMNELKNAGCVAFSDGRRAITNTRIMRRALEYGKMIKSQIFAYPDDPQLTYGGFAHEGFVATELGFQATPAESEQIAISRDLLLTGLCESSINIGPLSSKGSCEQIKNAKQEKINVNAFTAAHYLMFNDGIFYKFLAEAKVFPPFREESDRQALIKACIDGTIDFVVSDHNPHLPYEVDQELENAPFGISSLNTTVPTVVEELHHKAGMQPLAIAALLSYNIARRFNLPYGRLKIGEKANISCIDPMLKKKLCEESSSDRCHNTPYQNVELQGFPTTLLSKGRIILENNELVS